jgi:hypothetical protein
LFFPATILDGRRLSLKVTRLASVSVRTPADMVGVEHAGGRQRWHSEWVGLRQ